MLGACVATLGFHSAPLSVPPTARVSAPPVMETVADLQQLAKELNPVVRTRRLSTKHSQDHWPPCPHSAPRPALTRRRAPRASQQVGFWDPLGLSEMEIWDQGNEASIGWIRHAEIKHGRVAMAGFVGYIAHENGIHWPWQLIPTYGDYSQLDGLSPAALWNLMPDVRAQRGTQS